MHEERTNGPAGALPGLLLWTLAGAAVLFAASALCWRAVTLAATVGS